MANYLNEFVNPSSKHRGAPFWSWNCKLEKDKIVKQIEYFNEMGMGGVTIHSRTGLDTPYLGEEFMEIVKACIDKSKELGMKTYLYDEDRWPSGSCGGEVTKDEQFRERRIVFSPYKKDDSLLASYDITLKDGYLTQYKRLKEGETGVNIWYAYLVISGSNPWFNNQAYVNTLDKKAIQKFIELTHEKYKEAVGEDFGLDIPSIFTDEPQFSIKTTFGKADEEREVSIPYTDDFEESYREIYHQSFLDHLPEVFWELPDNQISLVRYRYHDHLTERFASAFSDTIGEWCANNNIKLTGHMMLEDNLYSQTIALGEAMRSYRGFQIPGIDVLCDGREYSAAKQAQSASHQMGVNEVTSELYGVTNWDYDFKGHKLQGDWQAAMGITHRVPHLSLASMAGEAKRDYPASIFYQSPWYKKYNTIETYFARVNTALKSGEPNVRVGVIHPIESYWLHFGPEEQTHGIRVKLQKQFEQITNWLAFGLIDFDYISEALMENLNNIENNGSGFHVGKMSYDVVIVPGCETLRQSTYDKLEKFALQGGKILFMGEFPKYIDAKPILHDTFFNEVNLINFDSEILMEALKDYRFVDMKNRSGVRSNNYIYQLRDNGDNKILFIANGKNEYNMDIPHSEIFTITLAGQYKVDELDAMTGKRSNFQSTYENGVTKIIYELFEQDSLLFYLTEGISEKKEEAKHIRSSFVRSLNDVKAYKTSEKNVLMLDQAEYSLNGEAFEGSEEVLRIDNILRQKLGYPLKMDVIAQLWAENFSESDEHILTLRYRFLSDIDLFGCLLALENPEICEIKLNSENVLVEASGYFVDESIKTIRLPQIKKGQNELLVTLPYSRRSNLEWSYILGDFGVWVYGNKAKITEKPDKIGCSDITAQGFPFYSGNFTFVFEETFESGEYELEVSKFRAPLLSVRVDGKETGDIMFSPYKIPLGKLEGKHNIEITAYGNRVNAFGAIHNCDESTTWFGPNIWRTGGTSFSYEYQLKRAGILSAPNIYMI